VVPVTLGKEVDPPVDLFHYQGIDCFPDGIAKISGYDEKRFRPNTLYTPSHGH
jgi:hypothetical protein